MLSHLLLPRELSVNLHLLSEDEYKAVMPSEYEIQNLTNKQLATQLIENAFRFEPDINKLSDGLTYTLQSWLLVAQDGRLFDVVRGSQLARDNIWKGLGWFFKYPQKNFNLEELNIVDRQQQENPLFQDLTEVLRSIVELKVSPLDVISVAEKLLSDYTFIAENPLESCLLVYALSGPMTALPDRAIGIAQKLSNLTNELNFTVLHYQSKFLLSNIRMHRGEFEKAEEGYLEVEKYGLAHDYNFGKAARNNRGLLLLNTLRLDEAIEIFSDLINQYPNTPTFLNNLADCYSKKGEMENAWKYAKQFLDQTNSQFVMSYEFIQPILHELGLDNEAKDLIQRVEKIKEDTEIKINEVGILLMRARQARYELNFTIAVKAINQAISISIGWQNLSVILPLLIERIHIFLELYEMKPNANNRQRLYNAVDTMVQFSDDQEIPSASIMGLQLRAEINLRFDDIDAAKEDLYNASKLAKEFNYEQLYRKTIDELETLQEVDHVPEIEEESIFNRIKSTLRNIIGVSSSQKYEKKRITTHGSFIMSNAGLPIFSHYLTDKLKTDSTLISGLISAVSSLLNEATQSHGLLRTIQRDDFALLFEPVQDYLVVSIVSEDSFEARHNLQQFTEKTRELMEIHEIGNRASEIPPKFEHDIEQAMMNVLVD